MRALGRKCHLRGWRAGALNALGALAMTAGLVGATGSVASAAVTRTVPTQFATIQGAVDASHPGDTVRILPGHYNDQQIVVNANNITITGDCTHTSGVLVNGAALDVNSHQGVTFTINGNGVLLECMEIINGTDNVQVYGSNFKGTKLIVQGAYNYASPSSNGRNFYVDAYNFKLANSNLSSSYYEAVLFDTGSDTGLITGTTIQGIDDDCVYAYGPNITVTNSSISNCAYYGIYLSADNADIEGNNFTSIEYGCVYNSSGVAKVINNVCDSGSGEDDPVYIAGAGSLVQGNTIKTTDYIPVDVEADNVKVLNNVIDNALDDYCVYVEGNNVTVSGNVMTTCYDEGVYTDGYDNLVISGNTIKHTISEECIEVTGDNIKVTNNIITSCYAEGVLIDGDNPVVTGNQISNLYDDELIYVTCSGSCGGGSIANNTVTNTGGSSDLDGIYADITGTGSYKVTGNKVSTASGYGMELYLTNGLVSGNSVTNAAQGHAGYAGYYISGDGNTITNNTALKNSDDGFQFVGSNNQIVGNISKQNSLDGFEVQATSNGDVLEANQAIQNSAAGFDIQDGSTTPEFLRKNTATNNLVPCTTADPGYVTLGSGTNKNSFGACGPETGLELPTVHSAASQQQPDAAKPSPKHAAKHGDKPAGPPTAS